MLVSRNAAKLLWGDVDPVGRRVTLPLESKTVEREVIGIVGDVKEDGLAEPAMPTVYEQLPDLRWGGRELVVKTAVPPASIAPSVMAAIHGIDPEEPVQNIRSMDEVIDATLTSQRFSALLLGLFAALALVLASVGIYSVLSYIVRGRSREIGIRSALGASSAAVVALVVKEGMTPAAIGIAIGGAGALLSGRLLEKLVFGVSASDPLTLASVAGALALVAFVACLIPAYRASRVNPLSVLRN
jgi:predicted lysophospholipase L1 biosynthesis ABC-type transport system permease subunit